MGTWATGITFTDSMLSDGSEMVNMMELGSLTATDLITRDGYDSNTCICALNAIEILNTTDRIPGHGSQTKIRVTDSIPGDGSQMIQYIYYVLQTVSLAMVHK